MGIQSFLIFGDNCRIFFKDMGYFLKKIMGYGILGPPFQGLIITQLYLKSYHTTRYVHRKSFDKQLEFKIKLMSLNLEDI